MATNDANVAFSSTCSIGDHVLVCADMFDRGGTGYLQGIGLGPALHTDPPAKTVFFVDKITRLLPRRKRCRVKILVDNAVLDVKDNVIFRLATTTELEEASPSFDFCTWR